MKTTPTFAGSMTVTQSTYARTATESDKVVAICLYNNCNVVEVKAGWALVHATVFAAQGIARQLGLNVYARPAQGRDHYAIRLARNPGCRVVAEPPAEVYHSEPRQVVKPVYPKVDLWALLAEAEAEAAAAKKA